MYSVPFCSPVTCPDVDDVVVFDPPAIELPQLSLPVTSTHQYSYVAPATLFQDTSSFPADGDSTEEITGAEGGLPQLVLVVPPREQEELPQLSEADT